MFARAFAGSMLTYLLDFLSDHGMIVAFARTSPYYLAFCKANVQLKRAHWINRLRDAFAAGWTFDALTIQTDTMLRKVTSEIKRTLRMLVAPKVKNQHTFRRVTTEFKNLRRLNLTVTCQVPAVVDLRPLEKLEKFSAQFNTVVSPTELLVGPSLTDLTLNCLVLPRFEAENLTSLSIRAYEVFELPSLPVLTSFSAFFVSGLGRVLPNLPPTLRTLQLQNVNEEISDFDFLARFPALEQFSFTIERRDNGLDVHKLRLWELPTSLTFLRLNFRTRFTAELDLSWLGRLEGLVVADIGLHAMNECRTLFHAADLAKCTRLEILDVFDVCNFLDCHQQLCKTHPQKIWPSLRSLNVSDRRSIVNWNLKDELKKA